MSHAPISTGSEWTIDLINAYDAAIAESAKKFGLDTYPNQLEIISSEQMIDAYSSVGMPVGYHHWSFGKQFINVEKRYRRGHMGLAYEMVINSNPCIAYLLEENSMTMQALVIAHACYGHNSFFKNNYLFKQWTNADSIIDYLIFSRNYISDCERRYGISAVEELIDACHALMNQGVDRYRRPSSLSLQEEKIRQRNREQYLQSQINDLWRTIPKSKKDDADDAKGRFPSEPQENVLYFIEKNAPLLEPWQREVVRIVRKIAQYFYPQRQTKVMNEGWATFWHYTILNDLYENKLVTDQFMLEFLQSHTNVIFQPTFDSPYFSGINPYTLGFNMFQDIKRYCENPTAEDKHWFPELVNTPWMETLDFAMRNFKDESFVAQYLSPKLIRDLRLFSLCDDFENSDIIVSSIHNENGYQNIRQRLARQYDIGVIDPIIQVYSVDLKGNRTLTLRHTLCDGKPLDPQTAERVMSYLFYLWKFPVVLESVDLKETVVQSYHYPKEGLSAGTKSN